VTASNRRRPRHVLRLCSVFEPARESLTGRGSRFDPIGGMQNHTAELSRSLDRRGIAQTVVTTRPPGTPVLQALGRSSRVERVGWEIPALRQLYSLPAFRLAWNLSSDADLVHVHLGEDLAIVPIGLAAARRSHLPLVITVHTSLRHTMRVLDARGAVLKTLGGMVQRLGQRAADAVIAITPRLGDELVADGVAPERVYVIPPGVNRRLFRGPFEDPMPHIPRPRVVFVGRLARQKGAMTLVHAARSMRTPGVHVVLVGDGPERRRLERAICSLGLERTVHITGFVHHEDIPGVFAFSDVVVLPSLYEELGSVLIEAKQLGVPAVASRTGGIPDVVADGVNGLLVPPGDPARLADAIDELLGDETLRQSLSTAAAESGKGYDWEVVADRVLDVYSDALERREREPA
jgi:glycogen(starch) synthase